MIEIPITKIAIVHPCDILYFSGYFSVNQEDKNFPTPRSSTAKIQARVFYFITFHGRVMREESGLTGFVYLYPNVKLNSELYDICCAVAWMW
jgi:hypothetical protein